LTFESPDQASLNEIEKLSMESSDEGVYKAEWSPAEPKPQVTASSTQQLPQASQSFYTRSVSLTLGPHQPKSLWQWFQNATRCENFPENPEETQQMDQLQEFFKQSEADRQRVKAGMDAIRKQKEDLKRARDAAAAMAGDA
jgi:hypothetical protein